ncbi:hypothetical protein EDB19DRAFT_1634324, partial [Suillus lakei]
TPEHMRCYASFYGPVALPNTGFCAFNVLSRETVAFRGYRYETWERVTAYPRCTATLNPRFFHVHKYPAT